MLLQKVNGIGRDAGGPSTTWLHRTRQNNHRSVALTYSHKKCAALGETPAASQKCGYGIGRSFICEDSLNSWLFLEAFCHEFPELHEDREF